MLLALTTASRVSELHKLNMSNMCDKGDAVEFHIGDLTKTRKVGDGPLLIQLTQYEKESKLDVDLTHTLEFLGLLVNSVDMTLAFPLSKDQDIRERCIEMHSHTVTARRLAKLVGKLTATVLAVVPGPLFCRELQMLKTKGLLKSQQNYEARVTLTPECKAELMWWAELLEHHNGQSFIVTSPDLVITTDTSKIGWGAVVEEVKTQGAWLEEELQQHINFLELRAAKFAVMAFMKHRSRSHVHLRMDNVTAVAYVNKKGGHDHRWSYKKRRRYGNILPCQEDHSYSRASARQIEYGGRFPIPLPTRQQLLEAGPTAVQDAESAVGPTTHRPVCRPFDGTATNVCELETGPESPNDGCLLMWVAGQDDVRLSTILPDQQMPG